MIGAGRLRDAVRDLVSVHGAPGAIAELLDGTSRATVSAGNAHRGTEHPRSPAERFRAGSITKLFVAATVLRLDAEGLLCLDDTVDRWLPGLVRGNGNDGARITVEQLLGHTSGLFNYTADPAMRRRMTLDYPTHRFRTYPAAELVAIALDHPPYFPPGSAYAYSNTGYVLAGMIIEAATGERFADQITERIIRPLDLSGTSVPGSGTEVPEPHARHYSRFALPVPIHGTHDVTTLDPTMSGASGEIISTVTDLNRLLAALLRGEVLPAPQRTRMFTPVPGSAGRQGLGIRFWELPWGTVVGHNGTIPGSLSYTFGAPDGGRIVTFNVNSDWQDERVMVPPVLTAALAPG